MVRLHSPATGRLQILELKILKLILTKKLEPSLLAPSEDWQQHFRAAPQGAPGAQPGLSARGAAPWCPQSTAGPATADRLKQQSSNDLTSPNVPVLQLCCLRQHFPTCSSPGSPAASETLQFHRQVLRLNSSPRLLVKVKSHSLGLIGVRSIPPSSIKHWNNIPNKDLYQSPNLGLLHCS